MEWHVICKREGVRRRAERGRMAIKERFSNTQYAPHVDRRRVLGRAEEDIGRTVPKSHYFVRIRLGGDGLGTGQSEIGQL